MPRADIVVLNDMHPDDFPGAASIAYSHSKYLSTKFHISFWHTTLDSGGISSDGLLEIRSIHRNRYLDRFLRKYMATRLLTEFTSFLLLLKLTYLFLRNRPKLVWVNQIGVRFPQTITLIISLLGISIVQTFHDFGVISPRKLYPKNILGNDVIKLSDNRIINGIYSLRRYSLIYLANKNYQNICISEMQASIYKRAGVRNISIIPNGIEFCSCQEPIVKVNKQNEILFAGRSTGKGFERICLVVGNNPNWKLLIAGNDDLADTAKKYLQSSQYDFLGFLTPVDLFSHIHRAKLVSVISECYDVYPTIALEALMHNSKVLVTESTGVANLFRSLGYGAVVDSSDTFLDLDMLFNNVDKERQYSLSQISLTESGEKYSSFFDLKISPGRYC
jgi:glycosyltransferase involved in cell wall biosynthesis